MVSKTITPFTDGKRKKTKSPKKVTTKRKLSPRQEEQKRKQIELLKARRRMLLDESSSDSSDDDLPRRTLPRPTLPRRTLPQPQTPTPQGQVKIKISIKPLLVRVEGSEVVVSSIVKPLTVSVERGEVLVSGIIKPLTVKAEGSEIVVKSILKPLTATFAGNEEVVVNSIVKPLDLNVEKKEINLTSVITALNLQVPVTPIPIICNYEISLDENEVRKEIKRFKTQLRDVDVTTEQIIEQIKATIDGFPKLSDDTLTDYKNQLSKLGQQLNILDILENIDYLQYKIKVIQTGITEDFVLKGEKFLQDYMRFEKSWVDYHTKGKNEVDIKINIQTLNVKAVGDELNIKLDAAPVNVQVAADQLLLKSSFKPLDVEVGGEVVVRRDFKTLNSSVPIDDFTITNQFENLSITVTPKELDVNIAISPVNVGATGDEVVIKNEVVPFSPKINRLSIRKWLCDYKMLLIFIPLLCILFGNLDTIKGLGYSKTVIAPSGKGKVKSSFLPLEYYANMPLPDVPNMNATSSTKPLYKPTKKPLSRDKSIPYIKPTSSTQPLQSKIILPPIENGSSITFENILKDTDKISLTKSGVMLNGTLVIDIAKEPFKKCTDRIHEMIEANEAVILTSTDYKNMKRLFQEIITNPLTNKNTFYADNYYLIRDIARWEQEIIDHKIPGKSHPSTAEVDRKVKEKTKLVQELKDRVKDMEDEKGFMIHSEDVHEYLDELLVEYKNKISLYKSEDFTNQTRINEEFTERFNEKRPYNTTLVMDYSYKNAKKYETYITNIENTFYTFVRQGNSTQLLNLLDTFECDLLSNATVEPADGQVFDFFKQFL